jgi:hypothetical protein
LAAGSVDRSLQISADMRLTRAVQSAKILVPFCKRCFQTAPTCQKLQLFQDMQGRMWCGCQPLFRKVMGITGKGMKGN